MRWRLPCDRGAPMQVCGAKRGGIAAAPVCIGSLLLLLRRLDLALNPSHRTEIIHCIKSSLSARTPASALPWWPRVFPFQGRRLMGPVNRCRRKR